MANSNSLKTLILTDIRKYGSVRANQYPYQPASVRLAIQRLRAEGHNISFANRGEYRLGDTVKFTEENTQAAV